MKEPGSYRELAFLTIARIRRSSKRLFLLDLDGTLVDIADEVADAVPSEDILNLLNRLSGIPGNHLVIITGRSREAIEHLFGKMNIDIVAEHGASIRESGLWKNLSDGDTSWKEKIIPVIGKATSYLPGSIIENKQFSVAWHYRKAENRDGMNASIVLTEELRDLVTSLDLVFIHGKKVIEIMSNRINKGLAALYLINKNDYDFILSIGDDTTDEDMFRSLKEIPYTYTVKIGSSNTQAKFKVNNLHQVKRLLERLAEICEGSISN